jgi:hypothetical protein
MHLTHEKVIIELKAEHNEMIISMRIDFEESENARR